LAAVLGISGLYHDAAAALVVDGRVLAAIHEERLDRVKHSSALPVRAARACLELGALDAGALDAIVFYEEPFPKFERLLSWLIKTFPRAPSYFARSIRAELARKLWLLDELAETFGVPREKVRAVEHHRSHAASAFFVSPFEEAAVLTVDGVGERTTTAIWHGQGTRLSPRFSLEFPHSLGLFYAALTAYAGFEVLEGELKLMALAAYGSPKYTSELSRVLRLGADGDFSLEPRYFDAFTDSELGFGPELVRLLGAPRAPDTPWNLAGNPDDRRYADVARSAQLLTEEALLALARRAKREVGGDALCLAGGVALNAAANARLAAESGFSRIFVQPAAGDAGGALGAALLGALELGDPRPPALVSPALGQPLDAGRGADLAARCGFAASQQARPYERAAEILARGGLVALASGRGEWGPRALGHRSLLAPAHDARLRDALNRRVKNREIFRPFAPSALHQNSDRLFDHVGADMTPFMTTVCRARDAALPELSGVVHVDGTSRLHSVTPERAPALAQILAEYERRTGYRALLNTSLNGAREPIAGSETDAIAFFASHRAVDALLLDDVLVERRPS
jgi:carbamoyltransferase